MLSHISAIVSSSYRGLRERCYSPVTNHLLHVGLMWLLLFIYLWPLILTNKSIVPYDVLYSMEPWNSEANSVKAAQRISGVRNINSMDGVYDTMPLAEATRRQLQTGHLPVWDTNTLTGFPLGAVFSTYPINLFALSFLSSEQWLRLEVVFHLLLLSLFAYLLVISLDARPIAGVIAGITAAINGIVIYYLISRNTLPAVSWMLGPFWCFTCFKRERSWRWTIAGGLCYGMLVSTTHAQLLLYASLVYGAYVSYWIVIELWHRLLRRATAYLLHSMGMVLIGILIGLPALVMIFQFKSGIERPPIVLASVPLRWWIWILVPSYWGDVLLPFNITPGSPLQARVYVGIIPLALAVLSFVFSKKAEAKAFMILALSLIAVTLALPPFSNIFYLFMPQVYLDHTRILFVSSLLFAICAGLGMDSLLRVKNARILMAWLLGSLAAIMAVMLSATLLHTVQDVGPSTAFRAKSILIGIAFAVAGLIVVLVWRERFAKVSSLMLVGLVAIDLFSTFWHYQAVFPSDLMQPTPIIQRLANRVNKANAPRSRVYYVEGKDIWGLRPQLLNYFDIPQITGYTSLPIARYNMYTFASGARGYSGQMWRLWMEVWEPRSHLLDALGAEYVLVPRVKLIDKDRRVPLLPDKVREVILVNGTGLPTLPELTNQPMTTTLSVPANGRSFVLTGLAVLDGSVSYELNVNGESIESGSLSKRSELPFWQPLAINLTPFAGRSVAIDFQVQTEPNSRFRWVDPALHFNPDGSDLLLVDAGGLLLYQNTKAFPRAWLVHDARIVPTNDVDRALAALRDKSIDLHRTAVVESTEPLRLGSPSPQDKAEIVGYEPTRVTVRVKTSEGGLLVLPDIYHPTWRAAIDTSPAVLYPTNVAMRGVVVPPGEHTVEFYYDETAINIALMIALGTGAVGTTLLVLQLWRALKNKGHKPINLEKKSS